MACFHRNEKGVGYFTITRAELIDYSDNPRPICDECLRSLTDKDSITLVPILNEAFCPNCTAKELARIGSICEEDQPIAERRERFYANYFACGLGVS